MLIIRISKKVTLLWATPTGYLGGWVIWFGFRGCRCRVFLMFGDSGFWGWML